MDQVVIVGNLEMFPLVVIGKQKHQRRKKKTKASFVQTRGKMMVAEEGKEQVAFPGGESWPPLPVTCNTCALGHLAGSWVQEFPVARRLQPLTGDGVKPMCISERCAKAFQNQNVDRKPWTLGKQKCVGGAEKMLHPMG